ncbi:MULTISPECIES: GvpL/GvpF family gas vesicle protein [unclassified Salipiger]|uniref:GvpL/GvpF family gas vesicle protein n=1 Tax=unclassified Salipiger TaxID=2640570 RepID=UPI0013B7E434|nr:MULTISPECIES: GvpL/GvpF family gas vesicle protein [unclassified Salipiger]NDV52315.1 GvpL/GvpF family gas vesicle protein [Salipiger sp. PrR003]NDW30951.1 GvpL/GvpF family gas vesicle protein [Salipiger sp. PrR007]
MTAAYLYGLLRCDTLGARLARHPIDGAFGPVQALAMDGAVLAMTPHDGQPVPQRRRYLMAHARVLEVLMSHGPVLPFRFGHVVRDTAHLSGMLRAAKAQITRNFTRIEGHAEVGLRVEFDRTAALQATLAAAPGLARQRDALLARGGGGRLAQIELGRRVAEALEARRTVCQHALLRRLAPLARAHVLHPPEDDVQVLRAAFLLPETAVEAFSQAADQAASSCDFAGAPPHLRLVHPTPPFNFVSFSLAAEPDPEVV